MKRFLLVFPILAMLLCACIKQTIPPEGTIDSTVSANFADSTASTSPSATTTMVDQTDPVPIFLETKDDFTNFIRNTTVDGLYLYSRALGCIFEKPEDLPAYLFFYGGVGEKSGQFAQEETTFLLNAFKEKNPTNDENFALSATKMPVTKINSALSVLGVTIEDIQIPDQWVYYDKTDSYYFWVTDFYSVEGWFISDVKKEADGKVEIYWETKSLYWGDPSVKNYSHGAKMILTMQAMSDGTYRILSNLPQE